MTEHSSPTSSDTASHHGLVAAAINAIGQPDFPAVLAQLCETVSGYGSTFIAAHFTDHRPVELFDTIGDEHIGATVPPYVESAYLLDPYHELFRQGIGLFDETGIIVRFDAHSCLIISLGDRKPDFALSAAGRRALEALLPVVAALCRRHWPRLEPQITAGQGRLGHQLEKSFERFGTSFLSDRESEIARLVLKGHSSKSIARLLGNSPETVKVHRKRIYAKLNIASQGELFSMFLDALSRTPPNADGDPLTYLGRGVVARPDC
ncbi:MAG: LuxR C-terminal-related transcriptional regulator [Phyllobacteriaceae bacterium]|nr:LuxR C-terminal-related transcriptional regulator [Phyllobacteriaceae bacterium]